MMNEQDQKAQSNQTFKKRTLTTAIGIPIVAAMVWFDTPIPWFALLAVGWGLGGVLEFYSIVRRVRGLSPLTCFGAIWTALFIVSAYLDKIPHPDKIQPVSILLLTAIIIPLLVILARRGKENAFTNFSWTIAGIFYVGLLFSYTVALRTLDNGRGWLFLAILCTFASDIFAYCCGRVLGKHKMAPYISPHKSWEGAAAGVIGSIILSLLVVYLFGLPLNYGMAVILGILVSIMGQLGDLVKSLFKRNMAIKDSGNVLPGHGGFLDRMDSMLFSGVTVFYFVILIIH
jgi:phosphatidate cytidylyltransferase